jgi:hypothetical protein
MAVPKLGSWLVRTLVFPMAFFTFSNSYLKGKALKPGHIYSNHGLELLTKI